MLLSAFYVCKINIRLIKSCVFVVAFEGDKAFNFLCVWMCEWFLVEVVADDLVSSVLLPSSLQHCNHTQSTIPC